MTNDAKKIQSFTDLKAWQEGHKLVLIIYGLTKDFPNAETYGLRSQMQRAAVSITSNIAEGFSRFSSSDKKQFYMIAKGSLTELQNQLLVARDVGYLSNDKFAVAAEQSKTALQILIGLTQSTSLSRYNKVKEKV